MDGDTEKWLAPLERAPQVTPENIQGYKETKHPVERYMKFIKELRNSPLLVPNPGTAQRLGIDWRQLDRKSCFWDTRLKTSDGLGAECMHLGKGLSILSPLSLFKGKSTEIPRKSVFDRGQVKQE